jgi:5-methylcytosine-specific restriction endonuclease McrA
LKHRSNQRKKNLRSAWIVSQGGMCFMCGCTQNLEVDHVDPATKRWDGDEIWGRSEPDRISELAGCQVLCRDCHKLKTKLEPHYNSLKTRCKSEHEFNEQNTYWNGVQRRCRTCDRERMRQRAQGGLGGKR